ncbi:hypothetical protein BPA_0900023 (plasmid) [Borrelia parkeri SLO]|uniref:Uncharacterized protein n=1 Tax=Borrelia parkeri SLO TaxID=1313294 RepID=W5SS95_BORPR|nr:hypothetical protein BPA_0900023 [Borrelia parkeri SLO]
MLLLAFFASDISPDNSFNLSLVSPKPFLSYQSVHQLYFS